MEHDFNPFLVTGYRGPEYFCDREKETQLLKSNISNHKNTTLFAVRRLGKTGLIHHVFKSYGHSGKTAGIYVDILGTRDLKEFTNQLATAIYTRFPENKGTGRKIMEFFRHLRPVLSFDPLTGNPEVSFETGEIKRIEKTIGQLFTFLDKQNIKTVIAIDEFQQILEYPEKNTEAILRSYIQTLKNTVFIFCGSNQKMMNDMFHSARRPFYASCSDMHLHFIDKSTYALFIRKIFTGYKRKISAEGIDFILDWTCQHTYYTQYFCNFLFALKQNSYDIQGIQKAASEILIQQESTFFQYRNLITQAQWNLLQAVASETKLFQPHSSKFISRYKLGTSSMVTRGISALIEKELIYYNAGVERPYYEVYDKFLMRWMQYN